MYAARCPVRRVRVGGPRKGLVLDEQYLRWIRKQPCVCCGTRRYVEAAHVGSRGLGQKCSDRECLPLCGNHHVQGPHSHHVLGKNFFAFWKLDRNDLIAAFNRRYMRDQQNALADS